MEEVVHKISVRDLVEYVLRHGDIISMFMGSGRALAGTRAHQKIQKSRPEEYRAEVTINAAYIIDGITIQLSGRIDGVWPLEYQTWIEEIKSTTESISNIDEDNHPLHWAQAKIYACLYAQQEHLESIGVLLTYYQLDTQEQLSLRKEFSREELECFLKDVLEQYAGWAKTIQYWQSLRNDSIQQLAFPFSGYRAGQRQLSVAVYKAIQAEEVLFAQAPTGIGKTVGVLFPALKAIANSLVVKAFYLTAKTIGRTVAENTLQILRENGLRCKVVTLTAKEKICFNPGSQCHPDECLYAKGYFDREKEALTATFEEDFWTREVIVQYAQQYTICPFEFSLQLSLWADIIIGDYNYAFDPRVYLKRFFEEVNDPYAFLIDEAHNLPDRARDMYSAELLLSDLTTIRAEIKTAPKKIQSAITKLCTWMRNFKKEMRGAAQTELIESEVPMDLLKIVQKSVKDIDQWLAQNIKTAWREGLLDVYFQLNGFLRTAEGYNDRYITYYEILRHNLRIKLYCIDPAQQIGVVLERARSTIYFSATLLPISYFTTLLSEGHVFRQLQLLSPFPKENLLVLVHTGIATDFKRRDTSIEEVAATIGTTVLAYGGNYLVYFPSYKYMQKVAAIYEVMYPEQEIQIQETGMQEEEKEAFLANFDGEQGRRIVAFAVMGGIFGEGIDLRGERLIGTIIVGVGLPQVCLEREQIRQHFEKTKQVGFEYAYQYPGINRVLQAGGRVIRTENDRGIIVLIDERYRQNRYLSLLAPEWRHRKLLPHHDQIREEASRFRESCTQEDVKNPS